MMQDEAQASATQSAAKDEQALQQPADAVQLKSMEKKNDETPQGETEAGPSIKADDKASAGLLTAAEKGKGKAPVASSSQSQTLADDSMAIVPTAESDDAALLENPAYSVQLLLPSGARHPYRIDEKYLTKRGVEIPEVNAAGKPDPFSISIYKLKELILREWRDEWEAKPASPSSIRLIFFGRLLDDKEQVNSECCLPGAPCIVLLQTFLERNWPLTRCHRVPIFS